tara:strand:- start:406 stop:1191 length:786 start_codon:yes stop_codon:yes gene_type:complete
MPSLLESLKRHTRSILRITVSVAFALFVFYSVSNQYSIPNKKEIQNNKNISSFYNTSYQSTIKKSRLSAVQVISMVPEKGMISAFTGTYFEAYGDFFVVSVAHGIHGPCEHTKIVFDDKLYNCKKYIYVDAHADYSIIQIDEILERSPIKIPRDLPKNKQWIKSYSILNKVVYTGYPNTLGPLTISGEIAGFSPSQHAYMISYAWQGSSGSGVFDHSGKYIGYVVAIDVGQTELGLQILQDVVLIVPAFNIDWTKVITEAE